MALTSGREHPYDFPFWALPLIWLFATMHLWFLWNLLLMVGVFIILAKPAIVLAPLFRVLARLGIRLDPSRLDGMGVQFRNPKIWLLTIPISVVASLLMQEPIFGADSLQSLIPKPATFVFYCCFFFFGAFLYRQGIGVRRWWTIALLPAAVTFCIGFLLLREYAARSETLYPRRIARTGVDVQQPPDRGERPGRNGFCLADSFRDDGAVPLAALPPQLYGAIPLRRQLLDVHGAPAAGCRGPLGWSSIGPSATT